jgi:hypothetical protein
MHPTTSKTNHLKWLVPEMIDAVSEYGGPITTLITVTCIRNPFLGCVYVYDFAGLRLELREISTECLDPSLNLSHISNQGS